MSDFKVYNKCLISKLAPHEVPNTKNIKEEIERNNCYLARWTSNFDCGYETEWYYVIKDDKWDISKLNSKDRNVITNGKKNFDVKIIDISAYRQEIYNIYLEMNKILPKNSRSNKTIDEYCNFGKETICVGAFDKISNDLCGYAILNKYYKNTKVINFSILRYLPRWRNKNVNAAIIDFICNYFLNQNQYEYICDGERSIRHDTTFQQYLEKYFGFRKCYCDLNIVYSKKVRSIIKILYPFKNIFKYFSRYNRKIYNIYCILFQEKLARTFRNRSVNKNV